MSLRTLKKLRGDTELPSQRALDGQNVSESDDGSERSTNASKASNVDSKKKKRKQLITNPFSLLDGEGSPSDTEAKEDDDKGNDSKDSNKDKNASKVDPLKCDPKIIEEIKHKNKKKRKSRLDKQRSSEVVLEEDEIDASIREVNKILGVDIQQQSSADANYGEAMTSRQPITKNILCVAHKHLNPQNEMKKIFGSRVVHGDQHSKKRGRHKSHTKATWLVTHRSTWPQVERLGMTMNMDDSASGEGSSSNHQCFKFEHNKQYQMVQFQFLEAVESYNPENIAALLRINPYHVDSLISLSDTCKMGEDLQMASELIERALYGFETCFHPLFNITQGTCRMDYRRPENRSFYVALFKHIYYVGQKGCYRTALEFIKFLLSLDPDDDPLGVLLMIDFYAIKSEQYEFLIRLYSEWEGARNLSKLPNFAFSVSLAKFHFSKEEFAIDDGLADCDRLLQDALIMFPGVLKPLLDKCGVQPDPVVDKHPFFCSTINEPPALTLLVTMFVDRCFPLWKEVDVVEWLEKNVNETIGRVDAKEPFVDECLQKRSSLFKAKLPLNICRHVFLSEIKDTASALPAEVSRSPGLGCDPLPPSDSIVSYTRPPGRTERQLTDHNALSMFFRSMLPNFTAEQHQDARHEAALARMLNDREDDGGGGGAPQASSGVGNDLRRSVTSLLDAMRDLLGNIHLPDVPRDGDGDDEGSEDDDQNE